MEEYKNENTKNSQKALPRTPSRPGVRPSDYMRTNASRVNANANRVGANRTNASHESPNRAGAKAPAVRKDMNKGGFWKFLAANRQIVAALIIILAASVVIAAVISAMTSSSYIELSDTNTAGSVDNVVAASDISETTSTSTDPIADPSVIRVVYIDPGHGYDDPGTHNDELGVMEKDVVLNVALALRDKLEECGITAYLTHDTNIPPSDADKNKQYLFGMKKRNALANADKDAGLFLSIHCNAFFEDETVCGPRLYYMKGDEGAEGLAEEISESLLNRGLEKTPIIEEMSGMKSYQVLRDSDMPAVLIETGFVSNEEEALAMLTDEWTDSMAEALCEAISNAFSNGSLGVQKSTNGE